MMHSTTFLTQCEAPLYGHEEVEKQFASAIYHKQMPHAYLITGMEGMGKATLAHKLAASLITAPVDTPSEQQSGLFGDALPPLVPDALVIDRDSTALTRMLQGTHSDVLSITPAYDEKKKRQKPNISVEQIRKIGGFMSLTAGESGWKIILIDPAEAMNPAAANALLKWLEEPPKHSVFIITSHAPGRLLPTILSRCRIVTLKPLTQRNFSYILTGDHSAALYRLSSGAPGLALRWQETHWHRYWQDMLAIASSPLAEATSRAMQLRDALAKDSDFLPEDVQRLTESLLVRVVTFQAGQPMEALADSPEEQQAIEILSARHPSDVWMKHYHQHQQHYRDIKTLYLDARHVLTTILSCLYMR